MTVLEERIARIASAFAYAGVLNTTGAPFTWSSGEKAPLILDLSKLSSSPNIWGLVIEEVIAFIQELENGGVFFDIIAAVADGATPHAKKIAKQMGIPFVNVTKEGKIQGEFDVDGKDILIIEDVSSTGGNIVLVGKVLRNDGARVADAVCFVTHLLKERIERVAQESGIRIHSLIRSHDVIDACVRAGSTSSKEGELLKAWLDSRKG